MMGGRVAALLFLEVEMEADYPKVSVVCCLSTVAAAVEVHPERKMVCDCLRVEEEEGSHLRTCWGTWVTVAGH